MNKKVIMLVDNRVEEESVQDPSKNTFRGSAFKGTHLLSLATEIDSVEIP